MGRQAPLWRDRTEAGEQLARRLHRWRRDPLAVVVALPRGGVVVAAEVAAALQLPLVSWAVRKLTHPAAPEVAIGAIAPGLVLVWDQHNRMALQPELRQQILDQQQAELQRRQTLYGDPPLACLHQRHLLVVDDGVATGLTVLAALQSLQKAAPRQLVLAVPVIDRAVARCLRPQVDVLVALAEVDALQAVGLWYRHFEPVSDQQVLTLIGRNARDRPSSGAAVHRRETADRP